MSVRPGGGEHSLAEGWRGLIQAVSARPLHSSSVATLGVPSACSQEGRAERAERVTGGKG